MKTYIPKSLRPVPKKERPARFAIGVSDHKGHYGMLYGPEDYAEPLLDIVPREDAGTPMILRLDGNGITTELWRWDQNAWVEV